jgi:hypothetical protein
MEAAKKVWSRRESIEVNGFPNWFDTFYFGF